jgi:hypothetical protein
MCIGWMKALWDPMNRTSNRSLNRNWTVSVDGKDFALIVKRTVHRQRRVGVVVSIQPLRNANRAHHPWRAKQGLRWLRDRRDRH